ncbi:MAG: acyl-CoA desaturase [Xenococcaceae cyanobacterium]
MNIAHQILTEPLVNPDKREKTIASDHLKGPQTIHFILYEAIPFIGFITAIVLLWWFPLSLVEVGLFIGMWFLTQIGFSVGWHRLFSHNAFKTSTPIRVILAILGSMAAPGPLILAVAAHRRHHEFADKPEDPHSPHLYGEGFGAKLRGLWHAHEGWLVTNKEHANTIHYVPDLLRDQAITTVSRYYQVWVLLGLVIPAVLGGVLTGLWMGAFQGFLWGGLVRIFLVNNLINGVNSIAHVFGRRAFNTNDHSQNNLCLVLPALGEGWHNNHHAFPQSAIFGLEWWQIDIGGWVIRVLEKLGLVWDVKAPTAAMIEAKKAI